MFFPPDSFPCFSSFCFCSTVYVKALFTLNLGAGFTPVLPKTDNFDEWYTPREVRCVECNLGSTSTHIGQTLGSSANNFKSSDLDDLVAVPALVWMAAGVVGRRSGENSGCHPKLCRNSREAHRGFALETPIING